jgi:hypothetical protein
LSTALDQLNFIQSSNFIWKESLNRQLSWLPLTGYKV